jgi:hypothetical protein
MRPFTFASLLLLLSAAAPRRGGGPSPIEDHSFMLESGWNRDDAALQVNSFFLNGATSLELAGEWALSSPGHQLSYTIPIYRDVHAGLGDVLVNYRYQLVGKAGSRVGVAPRVSLILPSRDARFGERSSGLQFNVPVSVAVTSRLTSHTNAGGTWFRDLGAKELNLAQGLSFEVTKRMALTMDASFTRCDEASHLLVLRPGIQFSIDGPGGVQIAPALAFPNGRGVLVSVAIERSLH